MKRFVFAIMLVLAIVGSATVTVSAEGPAKPVIEGEMPDCYMPIGSDGITLDLLTKVANTSVLW